MKEESASALVPICACGCGVELKPYRGRYPQFIRGHHRRLPETWEEQDQGHDTLCWIWQRPLGTHGYGVVTRNGRQITAPRAFYETRYGRIPSGLEPDHLCQVKACVNPEHLELVTRAENARRGPLGKLTQQDIDEIIGTEGPHLEMAMKHGVTRQYVSTLRAKAQRERG